jgi:hypothetical protein
MRSRVKASSRDGRHAGARWPFRLPDTAQVGPDTEGNHRMNGRIGRVVGGLATGTILSAALAATAFAATPPKAPTWEAVAANFGRATSANAYVGRLTKAGMTGFQVEQEVHGKGHFQVERTFTTKAAAMAEVARLKAAKFHGGVEEDAAGSV